MKKIGSQPILSRVGSIFRNKNGGSAPDLTDSSSSIGPTRAKGRMTISTSADALSIMKEHKSALEDKDEFAARLQAIQNATDDMRQRIPAFRMLYISPMHLRERRDELKNNSFQKSFRNSLNMNIAFSGLDVRATKTKPSSKDDRGRNLKVSLQKMGRVISLFGSTNADNSSIQIHRHYVDLCFGGSYRMWKEAVAKSKESNGTGNSCHCCHLEGGDSNEDGYRSLLAFVNQLYHHMQFNQWKITLAQQKIGISDGSTKSAPTASYLLAKGKLHGQLLNRLLDEEIRVIRNLRLLTMPNERDVLAGVRLEYESIKARMRSAKNDEDKPTATSVSDTANKFVGNAIHKNFHPETGRFVLLKQFGIDLKNGSIHLKPMEVSPAKHLEKILNDCFEGKGDEAEGCGCDDLKRSNSFRKSSLEDTFDLFELEEDTPDEEDPLKGNPLYIHGLDQWQTLLELALSMKNPSATDRIW
jgi:hypothetical protein